MIAIFMLHVEFARWKWSLSDLPVVFCISFRLEIASVGAVSGFLSGDIDVRSANKLSFSLRFQLVNLLSKIAFILIGIPEICSLVSLICSTVLLSTSFAILYTTRRSWIERLVSRFGDASFAMYKTLKFVVLTQVIVPLTITSSLTLGNGVSSTADPKSGDFGATTTS